jgi:hypothetical protein
VLAADSFFPQRNTHTPRSFVSRDVGGAAVLMSEA